MCGHSNKVLGEAVTETVYTCDDSTHASTSRVTTPYTCPDCEITGNDVADVVGEPEKHTYVEGKCSVCEHICVHSNAAAEVTKVLNGYTDLVDATHTANYTVTTVTTCPDCGNVVTKVEEVAETTAHNYLDSKCDDCDHVCAHSATVTTEKFVAKTYEKKTGAKHIATGETYDVVTCADCEVKISETLTAENVQVEEKHTFSSGKCSKCGYKKPVEKVEEPAPVVEEKPAKKAKK
jgi:hypothetical protein